MKKLSRFWKLQYGFTLIELLVVITIIGILATLGTAYFRNAQIRGRDVQRKSDLSQLSKALEFFYNDYSYYPLDAVGLISSCPFNPSTGLGTNCTWGSGDFTDGSTTYFKSIPKDPLNAQNYFYRIVPGSNRQKFQIFARLENGQDISCIGGSCSNPPVTYSCGSDSCNFAVTSANALPTE